MVLQIALAIVLAVAILTFLPYIIFAFGFIAVQVFSIIFKILKSIFGDDK